MFLLSPRRAVTWFLAASAFLALHDPRPASAQDGKFYLSWNAPYGEPRASDQRAVACGDSSQRDTLYVTFDPERETKLVAVDAQIRVTPAAGDTLERHWWFESLSNPAHLVADFNLNGVAGAERIWDATGAGGIRTVSGRTGADFRLVWAVRPLDIGAIHGGHRYGFARLVIPRPANRDVCARPVCMELVFGRLAYDIQDEQFVREGKRWVSWNPNDRAPCAAPIRKSRVTPWRPPRGR